MNLTKPLCVDLFCGLGGWSEGFIAEGYTCIGFDIERHDYGTGGYPGQLVIQDVLTLHGSQFKDAAVIVASPPCQKYSYMAMPWMRAKAMAAEYRSGARSIEELNALFNACFRIAEEAGVPLIVENVRGAQPWVGPADWNYGSFYLWGDVPALMPFSRAVKVSGLNWSGSDKPGYKAEAFNTTAEARLRDGQKVSGFRFDGSGRSFQTAAVKTVGHANIPGGHTHARHLTNQRESDGIKQAGISGTRANGKGDRWFQDGAAQSGSKSKTRKAASAQIAKIPFPLARHIAQVFKPVAEVSI